MSDPSPPPASRYAAIAAALLGPDAPAPPGTTTPVGRGRRRFGEGTLKEGGKIFAMLVGDQLVVKLPAARVDDLVASGAAQPYDAGKGRPMKEWASVPPGSHVDWLAVAREAQIFVRPRR